MSALPSHQLPTEINASTMIIRSARGHGRFILDCLLTAGAWVAFIFLFARGLWSMSTEKVNGVNQPSFSHILPTLSDLSVYIFAMLVQGGILILWAQYNYCRFRGALRRTPYTPLAALTLLHDYGISAPTLQALRTWPLSVIHHAHDGSITRVENALHAPTGSVDVHAVSSQQAMAAES